MSRREQEGLPVPGLGQIQPVHVDFSLLKRSSCSRDDLSTVTF